MNCIGLLAVIISLSVPTYQQKVHLNLKYGNDPAQLVDVYEPVSKSSKAIILIHGGGWYSGKKEDMATYLDFVRQKFQQYLICNMDYRLGNTFNPGYPKQLEDIDAVLKFLRSNYGNELKFALAGASAGAHIAMLYSYKINADNAVKAVVDIVGPADLTAESYAYNIFYNLIIMNFVGPNFFVTNPQIYNITSPTTWITPAAPKTIGFYGDKDPLVPLDQGPILKAKLDKNNVVNEFYRYPGGHGDWAAQYQEDMKNKTIAFINKYF